MTTAYPLEWPPHKPRTQHPKDAAFQISLGVARDHLLNELRQLQATHVVISANMELRLDGLPYANQKPIYDEAIAVYFMWKNNQMCFACDRWRRVKDNMRAVGLTVAALRGLDRWGTGEMVDAAFQGFMALPAPVDVNCWTVLGIEPTSNQRTIRQAFKLKAKTAHPDTNTGSVEKMTSLVAARDAALFLDGASL